MRTRLDSPPFPARFSNDSAPSRVIDADDAIRGTDDDALTSRLSALALGYIPLASDPFTPLLTRSGRAPPLHQIKRAPLINVGTHHRSWAMDRLVEGWLGAGGKRQVVVLGAGSDSRFWRIKSSSPFAANLATYIELDFPHITSLKARRISLNKTLASLISRPETSPGEKPYTVSQGGTRLDGQGYHLVPLDLRQISSLESTLLPLLDTTLPTLFLAECLFCYMAPKESHAVIEWFGNVFGADGAGGCMGVVYEMCGLDDSFGAVMKRNLMSRGIPLPGATYKNPADQASRFLSAGYNYAEGMSMKQVRRDVIPKAELERISKLEFLDEVEELELVLEHYCVAWGVKVSSAKRSEIEQQPGGWQRFAGGLLEARS